MNLNAIIQAVSGFVFGNRRTLLIVFGVLTVIFVASASRLTVDAGFNKMVPLKHPYMKVYRDYEKVFGSANRVAVAIVQKEGDIFDKEYLAKLKDLTDDLFLLNGVDRPSVKSLFTPNTRFIEVIEEGFAGGNVIPATFQGTDEDLKQVRSNVQKSSEIGRTVATDFTGALVTAGLLEIDPQTGKRLNYFEVAAKLEQIRAKYQSDRHSVHIIGFAKAVGDIRDGARGVLTFFGVAFVITAKPSTLVSSASVPGMNRRAKERLAAVRLSVPETTSRSHVLVICTACETPIEKMRKGTRMESGSMP